MYEITVDDVLVALVECAGRPDIDLAGAALMDTTFQALGYDSLALIEATSALEQRFNVHIPDRDLADVATFGQLVARANGGAPLPAK